MKLTSALSSGAQDTEVLGSKESASYTISANAQVFSSLISNIYSDKIGSPVREICCNAADAHVMNDNTDTQFEVHLPTAFEPWFSVRDYGPGMSHEFAMQNFTALGNSTKNDENDSIGAFGFGCKSPFAYGDDFSVTVFQNGVARAYQAYRDERDEAPRFDFMQEQETDESDGVLITVSVSPNRLTYDDFSAFREAVQNQLMFFKNKPKIVNDFTPSDEFWPKTSPVESFNRINFIGNDGPAGFYIVQGGVGYEVSIEEIKNCFSTKDHENDDLMEFVNSMFNRTGGTFIEFDIGQIGVTASREKVEFNNITKKNISNVIKDSLQTFIDSKQYYIDKSIKYGEQGDIDGYKAYRDGVLLDSVHLYIHRTCDAEFRKAANEYLKNESNDDIVFSLNSSLANTISIKVGHKKELKELSMYTDQYNRERQFKDGSSFDVYKKQDSMFGRCNFSQLDKNGHAWIEINYPQNAEFFIKDQKVAFVKKIVNYLEVEATKNNDNMPGKFFLQSVELTGANTEADAKKIIKKFYDNLSKAYKMLGIDGGKRVSELPTPSSSKTYSRPKSNRFFRANKLETVSELIGSNLIAGYNEFNKKSDYYAHSSKISELIEEMEEATENYDYVVYCTHFRHSCNDGCLKNLRRNNFMLNQTDIKDCSIAYFIVQENDLEKVSFKNFIDNNKGILSVYEFASLIQDEINQIMKDSTDKIVDEIIQKAENLEYENKVKQYFKENNSQVGEICIQFNNTLNMISERGRFNNEKDIEDALKKLFDNIKPFKEYYENTHKTTEEENMTVETNIANKFSSACFSYWSKDLLDNKFFEIESRFENILSNNTPNWYIKNELLPAIKTKMKNYKVSSKAEDDAKEILEFVDKNPLFYDFLTIWVEATRFSAHTLEELNKFNRIAEALV